MDQDAYVAEFLEANSPMYVRMNAHFYRLFLDACDEGTEHVASLRLHGRRINQTMFGLTSVEALSCKKEKKLLSTGTQFAARHPGDFDRVEERDASGHKARVGKIVHAMRKANKHHVGASAWFSP